MDKRQMTELDWLKRDLQRLHELIRLGPNGIAFCLQGKVVDANQALTDMLDRSAIGCELASLFALEVRESTQQKLDWLKQDGATHATTCHTQLIRADQTIIAVQASISRLEQSTADSVVVFRPLAVFQDCSILNKEELRQRAHMLRMSVFGELAASLVHELGQPVTAAIGAREMLLDTDGRCQFNEGNARAAELLVKSVADFSGKFKKIWDFVRMRKPERIPFGVDSICDDAIELTRDSARHSGVVIEFSSRCGATVTADSALVHLLLVSLLQRSVLALTSAAEPVRKIQVTTSASTEGFASIEISHSGLALSPVEQSTANKTPEETSANNLMLSTCQLIAEQNKGMLVIKPQAGVVRYQLLLPV